MGNGDAPDPRGGQAVMGSIGLLLIAFAVPHSEGAAPRAALANAVAAITSADYEGDRDRLGRADDDLAMIRAADRDPYLASRLLYWRGFARWRRAFNGINVSASPSEIESDFEKALERFDAAVAVDPGFIDARAGSLSCLGNLAFLRRGRPDQVTSLTPRILAIMAAALQDAPDHPRLLWVVAAQQRALAAQLGGGPDVSHRTLMRGLLAARRPRAAQDVLEPRWGEPELLMSLAVAELSQSPADARQAETYALEALRLVPQWRAVRENLMARIRQAKQQDPNGSDRAQIERLHANDIRATKAFDLEALLDLWTDDIVSLFPQREPVVGKAANRRELEGMQRSSGEAVALDYRQDWRELIVTGDYAFEWGIFSSTLRLPAQGAPTTKHFKVMRVLRREGGRWRVARTIWNDWDR